MVEIKNRFTGEVICRGETLRQACEANKAALHSADLSSADLRSADLSSADLRSADLRSADLRNAGLRSADLRSADLTNAVLTNAVLSSADLSDADFSSAIINWESHDICFALLRRAAGDDVAKRKAAGLVIASWDWCWDEFAALYEDAEFFWAITELAKYVRDGDNAPDVLQQAANELTAEAKQ